MLNTTTKDLGSNTTTEELIDFTASSWQVYNND